MKKIVYVFVIFCYFFTLSSVYAVHQEKKQKKLYKKAKKYYAAGNYKVAKKQFKRLTYLLNKESIYYPYTIFFYALSSYKNQKKDTAASVWLKMLDDFSDWSAIEEVYYWLAQYYFEVKETKKALYYLSYITTENFIPFTQKMKQYFLCKIDHLQILQHFLDIYPSDTIIAQILVDKIIEKPLTEQNQSLLKLLTEHYSISTTYYDPLSSLTSIQKDTYHIAVLLPFHLHESDHIDSSNTSLPRINPVSLALYQGMQLATHQLQKKEINIKLYAYDTKSDSATTETLLKKKEMKHMDLIVGPLDDTIIPFVSAFSRKYSINHWLPLSQKKKFTVNNSFTFLWNASLTTQAHKAAEWTIYDRIKIASDSIASMKDGIHTKKIGIIYGPALVDSIKAKNYQDYIHIMDTASYTAKQKLNSEDSQWFLHKLKKIKHEKGDTITNILDIVSHIYIASDDELIVSNILSAIEMNNLPIQIIGNEAWLHLKSITFDQLQRLNVVMTSINNLNYSSLSMYNYIKKFYHTFKKYPDSYTAIGYELIDFLGNMLDKYGVYFQKNWKMEGYKGNLFSPRYYGQYHDNQKVIFLQWKNDAIIYQKLKITK